MKKDLKQLLTQFEEFASNESSNEISFEDAHDKENWEIPSGTSLDTMVAELVEEEKLRRAGDYYQILGLGSKKIEDAQDMMSGGWME